MLVRNRRGEHRQRGVAVAPGHVAQHLVVGAVLLDDQEHMFDQRRLAYVPRHGDRLGPRGGELGTHRYIVVVAPVIVLEHLAGELRQRLGAGQGNEIDRARLIVGVEA